MKINDILHYSKLFYKAAGIKQNMAKRIMFSLLRHLVDTGDEAKIHLTKGIIDYQALKELTSGAEELIQYGAKACLGEAVYYGETLKDESKINQLKRLKLYNKAEFDYSSKNYENCLKLLLEIFLDKNFWINHNNGAVYGGEPWAKLTKMLLDINTELKLSREAKKTGNEEKQIEHLSNMTMYINIFEGYAHNTGDIMEKIVHLEDQDNYEDVKRLMDVKELEDWKDSLSEVLPILSPKTKAGNKTKSQGGLYDWIGKAKSKQIETDVERREKEFKFINEKKKIMKDIEFLSSQKKDIIKTFNEGKESELMFYYINMLYAISSHRIIKKNPLKQELINVAESLRSNDKQKTGKLLLIIKKLEDFLENLRFDPSLF